MISKTAAAGLLAAGCVMAAAGGAYFGVRQNAAHPAAAPAAAVPAPDPGDGPAPVSETEAIIGTTPGPEPVEAPEPAARPEPRSPRGERTRVERPRNARAATPRTRERSATPPPAVLPPLETASALPSPELPAPVAPEPAGLPAPPPPPPEPLFDELIIPSSSVIGLQVETAVSSERARLEDRVDARVTRDVLAAGRVAIPAGSRVIGAVTLVERGGKVKERARLGVRFHTVVLADGSRVPLRTEAILREGDAVSGESARKIGGAAVGGAILGAIMGGKKGAIIGGATGAGAGTAAVMAGDRNAAAIPAGAIVTARLSAPAAIEVERR